MDNVKYIGMDVHKEAICIAVLNSSGKLVMECTIETKASSIVDFLKSLRGSLHVTLEEGTWAAWLYDLINPQVAELVVCNPRRNALLKEGSKSDRSDARKLAELLRASLVRSVYHGENGVRTLRELARSYLTISADLIRVMTRVKAIYRSWGIPCRGKQVYAERYRAEWLGKIQEAGVRRRAAFRPGRTAARQETGRDSWTESQSPSRTEESIQGRRHRGRCQGGPVPRVLRCVGGQGHPARNGASDFGAQDGGHHLNRLEERSALRRPTSETTNSLSVSGASVPSWNFFRWWSVGFWRHSGSRASLS